MGRSKYQEYALYKGDRFICLGTAEEIAQKTNLTAKTIQWLSTPAYKKRVTSRKNYNENYNNAKIVIKLDNTEEY